MIKPSSIHTVTGYRILQSRYFVQLINLQSPNLNTHHATQASSTQPSNYTTNFKSHANKCTNIHWRNLLQPNIDSQSRPFNITFAPTWLSVGVQQVGSRQVVSWVGRYIDLYVRTLNTNIHTTHKYIHSTIHTSINTQHIQTRTSYVPLMMDDWNAIEAQSDNCAFGVNTTIELKN